MQVNFKTRFSDIRQIYLLATALTFLSCSCVYSDNAIYDDRYCDGTKIRSVGECQIFALGYMGALDAIAGGQTSESINTAIGQLEMYAHISERRAKQVVRALINYHDAVASHDDYSFKAPYLGCRLDPGYQLPRSRKERAKCKVSSTMFEHKDWWESHTATDP